MKVYRVVALICALCGLGACASITKGTTQTVFIDTPGAAGATCILSSEAIGSRTLTTPASVVLDKSQHNVAVSCKKACFQEGKGVIGSTTEAMVAGNLLAGGVIGLGIDAASGAMNKYNEQNQIAMVPIAGCKA